MFNGVYNTSLDTYRKKKMTLAGGSKQQAAGIRRGDEEEDEEEKDEEGEGKGKEQKGKSGMLATRAGVGRDQVGPSLQWIFE